MRTPDKKMHPEPYMFAGDDDRSAHRAEVQRKGEAGGRGAPVYQWRFIHVPRSKARARPDYHLPLMGLFRRAAVRQIVTDSPVEIPDNVSTEATESVPPLTLLSLADSAFLLAYRGARSDVRFRGYFPIEIIFPLTIG
ncbi:hypothetical protein HDF08_003810 [Edaphobacter lichenicola]|uniref:Uncharacterized protein n=1 Tax=Tunturiibacter lichenicola TaxID=2051959 RepID=A0A852VKJ9_9BACT|nr:hypothetical protein [Edaphobacter lichenicola]